jgi:hypothetical protein
LKLDEQSFGMIALVTSSVIDGRSASLAECIDSQRHLREYFALQFRALLEKTAFRDALPGPPDPASQDRLSDLLATIQKITDLSVNWHFVDAYAMPVMSRYKCCLPHCGKSEAQRAPEIRGFPCPPWKRATIGLGFRVGFGEPRALLNQHQKAY